MIWKFLQKQYFTKVKQSNDILRLCSTNSVNSANTTKFETVFSFPFVKYIGLLNRLKVYQIVGTSIAIPSSGLLQALNVLTTDTFVMCSYTGLTTAAVLTLASLPFKNIIGFLYISEDNSLIKISSVDFWGKRQDRIVPTEDWIPLTDMGHKQMDFIYLSPCLSDGTKYKFFVKFGDVLNAHKIGQVLE